MNHKDVTLQSHSQFYEIDQEIDNLKQRINTKTANPNKN